MFDIDKMVGKVIAHDAKGMLKHTFGIDTDSFSWVGDYLKDKELRGRIDFLNKEIEETKQLPIHRDELRQMFEKRIKSINDFRIVQISDHLRRVQTRKDILVNEMLLDKMKFTGASMSLSFAGISKKAMNKIFSLLEEGVKEDEIKERVAFYMAEIKEIETRIKEEVSPRNRWFYRDNGDPLPYPSGCRWLLFVKTWQEVSRRFEGQVDIEGYKIVNPSEKDAYVSLRLDKIPTINRPEKPRG